MQYFQQPLSGTKDFEPSKPSLMRWKFKTCFDWSINYSFRIYLIFFPICEQGVAWCYINIPNFCCFCTVFFIYQANVSKLAKYLHLFLGGCCDSQVKKYIRNGFRNRNLPPDKYLEILTNYRDENRSLNYLSVRMRKEIVRISLIADQNIELALRYHVTIGRFKMEVYLRYLKKSEIHIAILKHGRDQFRLHFSSYAFLFNAYEQLLLLYKGDGIVTEY